MNEADKIIHNDWRNKPLARAIVFSNCWLMLVSASVPIYAAPAPNQLPVAADVLVNANQGAATINTVGNNMTVNQTTGKAILNWKSFDIGKDGKVQFVQPSAQAIALNKIGGNSASQIFGQLGANGTIYLINNNGIVFGQGSQVNVHGLLASTLNVDDNKFLNSSIAQVINSGGAALEGGTAQGAVVKVENGATIKTDSGGQVLMFAPTVLNEGEISTPDGQTILAASKDKVYLATSNNDQDLRGLMVEVATGGDVTNVGKIVAERGNITLLGLAVNQNGRVTATTSVDVNGSIRLLARDNATVYAEVNYGNQGDALLLDESKEAPSNTAIAIANRSGTVKFGANSVTEVVADTQTNANGSVRTAPDAQAQNRSRIDAVAQTIEVGDNAAIIAKSGRINLTATSTPADPNSTPPRNASRIYLGKNTTLDVSGENVELAMDRRIVEVELRGDELKDSPLQRNGVLRGQKVLVDVATGSPLIADLQPTLAKVSKDVKERMVEGGTINLRSQGDVVITDNATLNTSGGSITYAAGLLNTTKLLTVDGRIVDIGNADPNQRYAGVLGEHTVLHPKWGRSIVGATSVFTVGRQVDSFTEGKNAGTLNIVAQALAGFDHANLQAGTQRGSTQRALESAKGGAINIELGQIANTVQNIVIDRAVRSAALGASDAVTGDAYISAEAINASGADKFSLKANGHVEVTENTSLQLNAGSNFSLTGTSMNFKGSVRAPSGSVSLTATTPAVRTADTDNQPLVIAAGSRIDVSGNWINDLIDIRQSPILAPLALKGGNISLNAKGDITIAQGANLLANGGAQLTTAGAFKGGDGGSIDISTNAISSADVGSQLKLLGRMSAYGFAQGGKLSVEANGFQIGGTTPSDARIVHIDPLFFTEGGFSDFTLTANLLGLEVVPQTIVSLQQKNTRINDLNALSRVASNADITRFIETATLDEYQRNPTNVHLNTRQTANRTSVLPPAYLRVGDGAQIIGDNGAKLDLSTTGSLYMNGRLQAHGGSINLTVAATPKGTAIDRGYLASQSLWLGNQAQLDVSAAIERANDPRKQLSDTVFDAGSVTLNAERGFIVAEPGSVIDVSAAQSYQITLPSSLARRARDRTATINPAAGSIAFSAADGISVFSVLRAQHIGNSLAGSISYLLDGNNRIEDTRNNFTYFPLEMELAQSQSWSNLQFGNVLPNALLGRALVSADAIANGGFGSLNLSVRNKKDSQSRIFSQPGRIKFGSDVTLNLSDALTLGATNIDANGHAVSLDAAVVTLGSDFFETGGISQIKQSTVAGAGNLTISGKTIDVVGNIGISGASTTNLLSTGDLRFRSVIDGTINSATAAVKLAAAELTTPGNLTLQAAQIYPGTLSDYSIRLTGTDSELSTRGTGVRTPLYSAAGNLTLQAPRIEHAGVLAAPLGTITLDASKSIHLASNSVIDVSAHDLLIPFGRLRGGELNWIYPINAAAPIVITAPPEKSVVLNAPRVQMDGNATVDLSGGGDIYAFEQIPGPGGSKDFLDTANAKGAFAVIPTLGSLTTPYDSVEMNGAGIKVGDTIWLNGSDGLPAGNYAVLPAHYALLPGAYLITPRGTATPVAAANGQLIDGTTVVSGRTGRGLSGQYATQWQTFTVETGAAARLRSEYKELTGDQFFNDSKVDLAADAGRMTISAQTALALNGTINAVSQNGRGAQLDIIADKIAVVAGEAEDLSDGVVRLAVSALNKLGIDSLMLGGKRTRAGDDTSVAVLSESVRIENGAVLKAPDIILAARDNIDVGANANVTGTGSSKVNQRAFVINGDGALLRASSAEQSNVQRTNSSGVSGNLRIDATATLAADKSLLLDASGEMALPGTLAVNNGSLNISANRISLGEIPNGTNGVALNNSQLSALHAQTLRLSSRSSLDFFGDVAFSNQTTELNSGVLRNLANSNVSIVADTLTLENGVNALSPVGSAVNGGSLILAAKNIVLGREGDAASTMQLQGFDTVQLGSAGTTQSVRGAGSFTLNSNSLTIYADTIGAAATGAKTNFVVNGSVALNKSNAAPETVIAPVLGASLSIDGNSITNGTRIELPSGTVSLNAKGNSASDNVTLLAGSEIDVSGRSIATTHSSIDTSGGSVKLTSANANVIANENSVIRLSGGEKGGDAGALTVSAKNAQALLAGTVVANKVSGARGANLTVDAGTLGNVDALLGLSNAANIDNALVLRAYSGDVAINQNTRASTIDISADNGKLSLASTLDASGVNGGHVVLNAGNDLELLSSAKINARATNDLGRGGKVELGSREGALRLAGAIDVSGGVNGRDGQVNLRVARSASNDSVAVFNSGIAITGAERVQLAAFKTYQRTTIDSTWLNNNAQPEAVAFMQNEAAIKAGLGNLVSDKFHLAPEIEVQSTGDLSVSSAVDFAADNDGDYLPDTAWRFGANSEAPILTLRAAGNLNIGNSISDGVYTLADPNSILTLLGGSLGRDIKLLMSGESASYRFIAGADLNAANPNTVGATGDLTIANGADVITGIGSVTLAAGRNIEVNTANSLIASLGNTTYRNYDSPFANDGFSATETLPDTGTFNALWAYLTAYTLPQYPKNGGDVSINAGGNIKFAAPTGFFSSWIDRIANTFTVQSGNSLAEARTFNLTTWGVMLENLKEGVVALGGGNIDVASGGSISNLNAALPSTGKQVGINANVVEITRSGSLTVSALQNILSPRLLVDNGSAILSAGGDIDAVRNNNGTAIGLQTVAVLGDASLSLHANGNVGVDAIFNTTVMPQSINQTNAGFLSTENYFFTYGDSASVKIESLQGDVIFNNDIGSVYTAFNSDFPLHANADGTASGGIGYFGTTPSIAGDEKRIFALYPSRLSVTAATGNINFPHDLTLYPATNGQLNLLAGGNIITSTAVRIRQSDADLAAMPSLYNPVRLLDVPNASANSLMTRLFGDGQLTHADVAIHLDDNEASVIDALGDIVAGAKSLYQFAESVRIAARDLISTSFEIQNNRGSDVSEIVASRDIVYPLIVADNGSLPNNSAGITISGPGRLDIFAGRDINLGTSEGFTSNGNQNNINLPDSGADLNVFAGINGPTAFSDPVLFNAFVDSYLSNIGGPAGNYIDWFSTGGFSGDAVTLLTVFTGKSYADRAAAMEAFAALPTLTQQAISLEAWRGQRSSQLSTTSKSIYAQLNGTVDGDNYSTDLIDFVSFDRFGGDLRSAVSAVTHTTYSSREEAATALALLSAEQQHQIAKTAFTNASASARRELLSEIFFSEIRQGGVEKQNQLIAVADRDGFNRSYAAIERMFPGNKWQGDISLVFSALRSLNDGDINFFAPGGSVDVGLAGQFAGFSKTPGELGIITQRYGAINGFTDGDININQSRISSLDGAGIALWSTHGNIDAGRGAKSALTIPPPSVEIDKDTGAVKLVFDAAVSGSGIQSARNNRKKATDRGAFVTDQNGVVIFGDDSHTDRDRYKRSLFAGSNYLFAPIGVIDAGDAGISVEGNLLIAAQTVRGADNINVGGVAIGVPTNTSISAGTLSLGNVASSATDSATGSMNEAIKQTAAALAEGNVAFVTVDVIGTGR